MDQTGPPRRFCCRSTGDLQLGGAELGRTRPLAPQPSITVGVALAFAYPVGPGAVTGTCRIVEVIDEPDRYGFVYATLPHHPEQGEELFLVERGANGAITAVIEAVWRPGNLITSIALPATRFFQLRATRRYLDGLAGTKMSEAPASSPGAAT